MNFLEQDCLSEIDDVVDRYIDGTYDAYVWKKEQANKY